MKRLDIDHPAIGEMISLRSHGNLDYAAGVRVFLTDRKEPVRRIVAYHGYLDAHDMTAYINARE